MVDFQCQERYGWEDLIEITRLLRGPGGCPWDAEQTHGSIRRNFLEETYEALDAKMCIRDSWRSHEAAAAGP